MEIRMKQLYQVITTDVPEYIFSLIPGFENYAADSVGSIWSLNYRGGGLLKRLSAPLGSNGYHTVPLYKDGKRLNKSVHTLIALAFIGERPEGLDVCHNNGNKTDNRLDNIRYDTRAGNAADRKVHGTENSGSSHGQAVLEENKIVEIRNRYATGKVIQAGRVTQKQLADEFGVSRQTINYIINYKAWGQLA
jgi:hypothetical protein